MPSPPSAVVAGPPRQTRSVHVELSEPGIPCAATPASGATMLRALVDDAVARHRGHELRYLAAHAGVTAIAVPDRIGDFDHQALVRDVAATTPGVRLLLVAGDEVAPDAVDLGRLLRPADDPEATRDLDALAPDSSDIAVFLLSGGTTGLPKLITSTHDDYEYNDRRSGRSAASPPTPSIWRRCPPRTTSPSPAPGSWARS